MTAEIAPQTDRLVWAVADRIRAQHGTNELPDLRCLSAGALSRTINLVQFMYPDIGEDFIRRRYVYASEEQVANFLDEMVDSGFVERSSGRLTPTAGLPSLLAAFDDAIAYSARLHWHQHGEIVDAVLPLTRQILETAPAPGMLVTAAQGAPEAEDECQRLYQRLAALRLMRNEAHVSAWRSHELAPSEVEVLTSAWAGSKTQVPTEPSASMVERGLAIDGVVTEAGLELRREIEKDTNARVAAAFANVDQDRLLDGLRQLPGPLD